MPGTQDFADAPPESTPLVLIAEDEEPIAEALADLVRDAGYRAVCAPDGHRALQLAHELRPALIITDYMMPRMSGGDLIKALRDDATRDGSPLPPIIVMSAAGLYHLGNLQADELLDKPFELDRIEALLHRYLGPKP